MNPITILFINRGAVLYGAETRMLDIIKHLDRMQFRPVVLLTGPGPLSETLKDLGIEVIFLNFDLGLKPKFADFIDLNKKLFGIIRHHKVDILHFNMHFGINHLWPVVMRYRSRTIVHLRSHFWIYPLERFFIYRCAKILCVSEFIKNDFLKVRRSDFLTFIQKNKLQVLYDGIDVNTFYPNPESGNIRKELNIQPNEKLIAVIGALHSIKGQHLVLDAAPEIFKRHPNVKILFVGGIYLDNQVSQDYQKMIQEQVVKSGLVGKVFLLGPRKDIPAIMNQIDILLQPSEREALGTSMVEAMSCQKPVIGTSVDGIPEVIGDNEAGLLLKSRTPQEIARQVDVLLSNEALAKEKAGKARLRAETRFNIHKTISTLENIYKDLAGKR